VSTFLRENQRSVVEKRFQQRSRICALKRTQNLRVKSNYSPHLCVFSEIIRKSSDCWSCHAIAVPNQGWFRDRRVNINARVGRVDACAVDQGAHRVHLLSAETWFEQRRDRHERSFQ
jgi:hypothetical protein